MVFNEPAAPFEMDQVEFLIFLRTSRRGSRPSGKTVDHLFPLLESEHDSGLLAQAASALARGEIPEEILSGFRLGRLTVEEIRRRSEGHRCGRDPPKVDRKNNRKASGQIS